MDELIAVFMERYLPRREIIHRLPLSVPIGAFWPKLVSARRALGIELPLMDQNGEPFWFVVAPTVQAQCDHIARLARSDAVFDEAGLENLQSEALIDEAVYSSMIEGAFTSREVAANILKKNITPTNRSDQMVKNNYEALNYVLEHLEDEITLKTFIDIAALVTKDASEVKVDAFRTGQVYVMGREDVVYTPPRADQVEGMMRALVSFLKESELHPLLKACIAHFYFVYVHPFADGNGRTARALTLMILLKSGFGFFRYFPISGIVAQERGRYYKAIRDVEESEGDMTYFIDFCSAMLERGVSAMEDHIEHHVLSKRKVRELIAAQTYNERQIKGAQWLLESEQSSITAERWRKKFGVVTETARKDLLKLCEAGILTRETEGRKAVFRIVRNRRDDMP